MYIESEVAGCILSCFICEGWVF